MMWHALLLSYSFGIGLGLLVTNNLHAVSSVFIACIGIFVWYRFVYVRALFGMLLCICIGYFVAHLQLQSWSTLPAEQKLESEMWVAFPPETKDTNTEVILRFHDCYAQDCPQYDVVARFPAYVHFRYGDILTLSCDLTNPQSKNEDFDYRMYLAMRNIGQICTPSQWKPQEERQGNVLLRAIFFVREMLEIQVEKVISYPESGLVKGLLFGGGSYLSKEMQDLFSRTGMSHIIAVSGANVVIIGESIFYCALLLGLWRRQAFFVAGVGIVLFVMMVGATASALRAGIMGGLVMMASLSSRKASGLRLWTLALSSMLTLQPLSLLYDIGFQLSFLATLGLLLCSPLLKYVLSGIQSEKLKFFGEIIGVSICVEAFVLPIIFYHFHVFSTVSIIANLLVLPCIPLAMLGGFFSSIAGLLATYNVQSWSKEITEYKVGDVYTNDIDINTDANTNTGIDIIIHIMAQAIGLITYLILHYMVSVIRQLGSFRYATVAIDGFEIFHMVLWYSLLGVLVVYVRRRMLP